MAFSTLDSIRTGKLNPLLGITTDGDTEPWGSTTVRNAALQDAFARLWPGMKRLVREALTLDTEAVDYVLTSIVQLETIERLDEDGIVWKEITNYRNYPDESAEPATLRVLLPRPVGATTETLRALGYKRYIVPASGAATCDLPPALEWIVVAGARAYLYLKRFNEYLDFAQRATANLENVTGLSEMFAAYQAAEAQYQQGILDNGPALRLPRRAKLTRR